MNNSSTESLAKDARRICSLASLKNDQSLPIGWNRSLEKDVSSPERNAVAGPGKLVLQVGTDGADVAAVFAPAVCVLLRMFSLK
jgi:hypothetical protein